MAEVSSFRTNVPWRDFETAALARMATNGDRIVDMARALRRSKGSVAKKLARIAPDLVFTCHYCEGKIEPLHGRGRRRNTRKYCSRQCAQRQREADISAARRAAATCRYCGQHIEDPNQLRYCDAVCRRRASTVRQQERARNGQR